MFDRGVVADGLFLGREWEEVGMACWGVVGKTMNRCLINVGGNIYDKKELHDMGFEYTCIGQ